MTTSAIAAPLASIFAFNDGVLVRALEGLGDHELRRKPTDRNNAMLWVAGHVAQTRAMLLQMLGEPIDTGWGRVFDRGAAASAGDRYPSGAEIERMLRELGPKLLARLAALGDDQLARPATMQLPGTRTFADELAFFAMHDSYHTGQAAYIRKALGYPGLVG
jgi:uncharacterized damage-inducible protein DinB